MRRAVAVLVALLAASCRSDPPPPAASPTPLPTATATAAARALHPQHLHTATIADPRTFNPIIATDAASLAAVSDLFDALVRLDPRTMQMEPMLAERWEISADGTEVTFVLRRDVRWHDGTPFTAADVVFTFDAIFDARVPSPLNPALMVDGKRVAVEALDDHTVRMRVPRPFAPLLSSIAAPIVPQHILGPALAAGEFAQQWGIETDPAALVGTGPYRMDRFIAADSIHLVRNPDYWMRDAGGERLPYLAEQTIRILSDPDAASREFLAGAIDIHTPRPEEIARLQAEAASHRFSVHELGLDTGTLFVTFNRNPAHYTHNGKADPRLAWFTDPHFLRAIAHGVDKQSIIAEALHGFGRPALSYLSPEDKQFYNPSLTDYTYDLAAARRELAAGGYADRDGDGVIEDRSGRPVEFTLHTNAGNPVRETICAILQRDWERGLGMRVRYKPLDFAVLVERLDTTFDWDAILMGFTGNPEPNSAASLLRSSGSLHVWHPNQKTPASDWEAEIDGLLDAGTRTTDPAQRRQAYWRIQEILSRELPLIPMVSPLRFTAATAALENYAPSVWGVYRPELIRFAN